MPAPAQPKMRATAKDVRPGQKVWPTLWRRRGRRGPVFSATAHTAVRHDDQGYLVIRHGKQTERLSPGCQVLVLLADDPILG